MILLTFLLIMAAIFSIIVFVGLLASGAAFIVIFGDLIVCVTIIVLIVRWLIK